MVLKASPRRPLGVGARWGPRHPCCLARMVYGVRLRWKASPCSLGVLEDEAAAIHECHMGILNDLARLCRSMYMTPGVSVNLRLRPGTSPFLNPVWPCLCWYAVPRGATGPRHATHASSPRSPTAFVSSPSPLLCLGNYSPIHLPVLCLDQPITSAMCHLPSRLLLSLLYSSPCAWLFPA